MARQRDKFAGISWIHGFHADNPDEWRDLTEGNILQTGQLLAILTEQLEYLVQLECTNGAYELAAVHQGGPATGVARSPALSLRNQDMHELLVTAYAQAVLLQSRRCWYTAGVRKVAGVIV